MYNTQLDFDARLNNCPTLPEILNHDALFLGIIFQQKVRKNHS